MKELLFLLERKTAERMNSQPAFDFLSCRDLTKITSHSIHRASCNLKGLKIVYIESPGFTFSQLLHIILDYLYNGFEKQT